MFPGAVINPRTLRGSLPILVWPDSLTALVLWRRGSCASAASAKHSHAVAEALEDPDPTLGRSSRPGVRHRKRR